MYASVEVVENTFTFQFVSAKLNYMFKILHILSFYYRNPTISTFLLHLCLYKLETKAIVN